MEGSLIVEVSDSLDLRDSVQIQSMDVSPILMQSKNVFEIHDGGNLNGYFHAANDFIIGSNNYLNGAIVGGNLLLGNDNLINFNEEHKPLFNSRFGITEQEEPIIYSYFDSASEILYYKENSIEPIIDYNGHDNNDAEGAGLTWSINPTPDAAFFNINSSTGILSFNTSPNFEIPVDDNVDNKYDIEIRLQDTNTNFTTLQIGIVVTDATNVNEVCTSMVTITDNESPFADCQDIDVFLDSFGNASITASDVDGGSTDNCGAVTLFASPTSFDCFDIGSQSVSLTATDGSSPPNGCIATVTVRDTISPTMLCQSFSVNLDVTGNGSLVVSDIDGGSFDNCVIGSLIPSQTSFTTADNGMNTITLMGTDVAGNSSSCDAMVDVVDPFPPNAFCQDITVSLDNFGTVSITPNDVDGGSTDNGTIVSRSIDISSFDCTDVGVNNVILEVTDNAGNFSTCTAFVTVEDEIDPIADVATLLDVTAQCEVTSLTSPTATDNCEGTINGTHSETLPITASTTITWTYDDGNGNVVTQNQNVVINDTTDPVADVATLLDVTAQCEVTSLTAPTATDNCLGTISGTHTATLPITSNTTINWTYDDGNGNVVTQDQDVIINDTTDPVADVASLLDITAQCEVTSLTAPTATDNCEGTINGTHSEPLPITANTTITWTYDDGNGNVVTQNQNVVINDTTEPVADVATLVNVTAQCEVTTLTAPTATDNCVGTINGTHSETLPITASTTVTWTYDDGNGNVVAQDQDVVINDTTDPVANVATLTTLSAQCEITSLTAPTATDNCVGTINGTHTETLPITASTTITWTYDDGNGNVVTQDQDVIINDSTDPVADVATLTTLSAQCEITSLTAPTATDNCVGTINGTHTETLPITASTTITWTYDDGNGNVVTQDQDVVINDTTNPVADVATLTTLTAQCEITSLTAPTATDNCVGTINGTHSETLPLTASTTITWTYDDGNGNVVTQDQDVVINDTTDPVADVATLLDVTAQCEVTSLTAPTATDNCVGNILGTHTETLPITSNTIVTWTYDDGNGNVVTQDQDVVINDTTDPVADNASLLDISAECEVTSLTAPTASDNCVGTINGTHSETLPITASTTITWTYDDGNGNVITQNQNVVINDTTDPVADVATLSDVTAQCEVTSLTAPTATDNCVGTINGAHSETLPITASTTITWTYDDGNGNVVTQDQDVVIIDTTDPVVDIATLLDVTAQCEVTSLTEPTATDNCIGTINGTHAETLPITSNTTITWTYDDGSGNVITQDQNVVINDTTDPVADEATLSDVTAQCEITSLTAPTATDNCIGIINGSHTQTLPITSNTTITWTYDDGNGNVITQGQNVIINDTTDPVADVATLLDVTAQCEVTSLTAPTATDNCVGTILGTHTETLPITSNTIVIWTYDDGNGNVVTQDQDVVINDSTDPVADMATLFDVSAQCEVTSLTAPTATDNCVGTINGSHSETLPITASTTISWTYDDGNGNVVTQDQDIIINDTTDPIADIATLSDVTAQCEVTSLTAPTATDNCLGTISGTHTATLPITSNTTITWTYDDGNGNVVTQDQFVIINDTTDPVADAALLTNITAQCEVTSLTAPTATDNCLGTINGTHTATLPITSSTTITWTYDDGNGNVITQEQNVIINDTTDPVADAASLTNITAQCEVTSLTAPTATDNCIGTISGTHTATLPLTSSTTITWTYDDGNGNMLTQDQNVVINDTTDPVEDAASLVDITAECEVTSLTAPTATDNCIGTINGTHTETLPITTSTTITWTYDDGSGNVVTQDQNVIINDSTDPIADSATLLDITAQCEVTSLTAPTATDNCLGTITGIHNTSLPISASTTITWTYDDGNGNVITQNQNVLINDTTDPVPDVTSLLDISVQCEVTSLTAPTATDNCLGTVNGTHSETLPITANTTIVWTYDDGHGNVITQDQNVIINDTTDPVADAANLSDITAQCEVTSLTAPTATDNCLGTINGTHSAIFPITSSTTITWTYDDGSGNVIMQDQNVVINDTADPVVDTATLTDITAQCEVTSLIAPTATDNCVGTINGTQTVILPITSSTTITWTYDDGNGNVISQDQIVIIDDTTNPVANAASLTDITAQCEVTSLTAPMATDNCLGTINGTHTTTLPITSSTTITWTYDDGSGNVITQDQNVIISDSTDPVADIAALIDITAQCEITSLTAPTATDNCIGTINGMHSTTFPITSSTTITWTYDDGNGNVISQDQDVVINDTTDPTVAANDLTIYLDATGVANIIPLDIELSSDDNCSDPELTIDVDSFDCSDIGSNLVVLTATDIEGNFNTDEALVTVLDTISPIALCQNTTIYTDSDGLAEIMVSQVDDGSNDACGINAISLSQYTFDSNELGDNTVVLTVSDLSGNLSTCEAIISTLDTIAPNAICQDTTLYLNDLGTVNINSSELDGGSTDNGIISSVVASQVEFDCNNLGLINDTLTVTDVSGNSSYCIATINVIDNIAPSFICPTNTTENVGDDCLFIVPNYTAGILFSDNCTTPSNIQLTQWPPIDTLMSEDFTVTITAMDESGNPFACDFDVELIDVTPPTITCPSADIQLEVDQNGFAVLDVSIVSLDSYDDNCFYTQDDIRPSFEQNELLESIEYDCDEIGANTQTIFFYDVSNNFTFCELNVIVSDTISPTMECSSDTLPLYLDENGIHGFSSDLFENATGLYPRNDNCSLSSFTAEINNEDTFTFTCAEANSVFDVDLIASDNSGNQGACQATIIVLDTISPVAFCSDAVYTVVNGAPYDLTVETYDNGSTDNCSIDTMYASLLSFDESQIGLDVPVTLYVVDPSGNSSECTSIVSVIGGPSTIVCDTANVYLDESGSVTLNNLFYNSIITVTNSNNEPEENYSITTTGMTYNCDSIGQTSLMISIINESDYPSNCTSIINILDSIPPVFSCPGDVTVSLDENCQFEIDNHLSGISITNNCPSDILPIQSEIGLISWDSELTNNEYPIEITATDLSGNSSSCVFNYIINPTSEPTIECSAGIIYYVDETSCSVIVNINEIDPPSTESCVNVTVTNEQFPTDETEFVVGVSEMIWTVTDIFNQTNSCSQFIEVIDEISPTITCPEGGAQCLEPTLDNIDEAIAQDNCTNGLIPEYSIEQIGNLHLISATVSDATGNQATCEYFIEKLDTVSAPDAGEDQVLNSVFEGILMGNDPEVGSPIWTGPIGVIINDPMFIETDVSNLSEGENIFTYEINEDGCISLTDEVIITVTEFLMPTGFSPNGDGVNDLLVIRGIKAHPRSELTIFDRLGKKIFSQTGYQNDWGGLARNGALLPRDTYFYILEIPGGNTKKGSIEIKY